MRIGIVVPTLGNRLEWLRCSLESIGRQPGVEVDVVIVTPQADAVREVADLTGARILQSATPGISAAVNEGWALLGDCEFWAWLGDDDVLAPGSLRKSVEVLMRNPSLSAAYGRVRYIDADDETLFVTHPGRLASAYLPWGKDLVPQPGSVFRRSAVQSVGGLDVTLRYAMDFDLFIRLRAVGPLAYIPTEVAAFRLHPGSITGANKSGQEAEDVRSRAHTSRVNRLRRALDPARQVLDRILYKAAKRAGRSIPAVNGRSYVSGAGYSAVPRRTVLVWRRNVLPGSETFIRSQTDGVTNWNAQLVGHRRIASSLVRPTDIVLRGGHPSLPLRIFDRASGLRLLDRLKFTPDIIHAHFLHDAIDMLAYSKRNAIPLIVTAHGHDVNVWAAGTDAHWLLRPHVKAHRKRGIKRLFRHASRVLAVSEFLRTSLLRLGADSSRVEVSYVGITPPPHRPGGSQNFQRNGVLFVGRLHDFKGPQDVLAAVARLDPAKRTTPVTIVGDGPLRRSLEELAAEWDLNVTFTGFLPPEDIWPLYEQASVFCGPSQPSASGVLESFGMVFLEAAAGGLPVVAYAVGGVPEAVIDGETGSLVPVGDIDALAKELDMYLSDEEYARKIGETGRSRVSAQFLMTQRAKGLESIYDSVYLENNAHERPIP